MMPRYLIEIEESDDENGKTGYLAAVWDTTTGKEVWASDAYVYGMAGMLEVAADATKKRYELTEAQTD